MHGDVDALTILARKTLLDTLELLGQHRQAVILIGAQAIYIHVGEADLPVAATTKDADIALDARRLESQPHIEETLRAAGFESPKDQIGIWHSPAGGQVDFLVPEAIAGSKGRRAAKLGTQGNRLARRTIGIEGALADHAPTELGSLAAGDNRRYSVEVAGPGALLVAKLHKIGERQESVTRLIAKDALDILRLLQGVPTESLAGSIRLQLKDPIAAPVASQAVEYLSSLFGSERSLGPGLAAQALEGLADADLIRASTAALASDLLAELDEHRSVQ